MTDRLLARRRAGRKGSRHATVWNTHELLGMFKTDDIDVLLQKMAAIGAYPHVTRGSGGTRVLSHSDYNLPPEFPRSGVYDIVNRFDSFNVRPELERIRAGIHMAGHVVAARLVRLQSDNVPPSDKVSVAPRCTDGPCVHAASLEQLCDRYGEIEARTRLAIVLLAGECAQRRWQPEARGYSCQKDAADAVIHAQRIATLTGEVRHERAFNELVAKSKSIAREQWTRIETIADAEILRGPLDDAEITRIMQQSWC